MKNFVTAALLLLLAGCTSGEPPLPPPAPTLSWTGYGPVHFGMTVKEAEAVAGPRADAARTLNPDCDYLQFVALPGMRLMVEAGVITRGDAGSGLRNALGIAVGDTLASVRAAHPEARVSPHKYDPAGHSVWLAAPDGKAGIVLEVQNGLITRIRAGLKPAVDYVESCS